ncbi:MAG TPA: hypothetical protein VHM70_21905 [Polyangiaceae bacterium]|jgi:hypothetical protein|nr:hypothetical protein [Polyangiaceae bacterium]
MSYNFPCDWKAGFVMDPTKKQRVGYLVSFNGIGLADPGLAKDITVFTPYNVDGSDTGYADLTVTEDKVQVVGVIENFSWQGGVGDPICISAYMSAENAMLIKGLLKMTLKTTSIKGLGWWVSNFDEETKAWFVEAHPKAPTSITGQLNAPGKTDIRIAVADEATKIAPNIDVNVYNIYFEVVPAANQTCDFHFATSKDKNFIKRWGLKVGTQAEAALAPTT